MTAKRLIVAGAIALGVGLNGFVASALAQPAAPASDIIIEKKVFELPSYTTLGGKVIKNVRIGWQSAGTLNADKSNAILITHFFSGTSQAFGKFRSDGPAGYWDAIIGPGKAIDTNKYFVIASDTLVNLNVGDPTVTTTGPASINPDTGQPYGMAFPVVQIGDFVNVQKALIQSLGITRLHAVMGASMGALQAYDWAVRYPDMVGKLIPVIGAGEADGYLIAWLDMWAAPIRVDPNWNNGDYYGKAPPLKGLAAALAVVSLHANYADFLDKNFGRQFADAGKDPAAAMENQFRVEQFLEQAGTARAKVADANHFLYLVKANQLYVAGGGLAEESLKKIKAPTLMIPSPNDLVFLPSAIERTRAMIAAGGAQVEVLPVPGPFGHLNGVLGMAPLGPKIAEFLAR